MPPEQARGELSSIDERSDIYSLGAILYEILTLQPPVSGDSVDEVLEKIRSGDITPPSSMSNSSQAGRPGKGNAPPRKPLPLRYGRIPSGLSAITMKALSRDPEERYPTATGLAEDIEAHRRGYATSAETVSTLGLLWLMAKRHRSLSISILVLLMASTLFLGKVIESERRARTSAERATDEALLAKKSELTARKEAERSRRALARAEVALATDDVVGHRASDAMKHLEGVPKDLRDQEWHYVRKTVDSSLLQLPLSQANNAHRTMEAVPGSPGTFCYLTEMAELGLFNVEEGLQALVATRFDKASHLAISAGAGFIAVSSAVEGRINLFDLESLAFQSSLSYSANPFRQIDASHDGRLVIIRQNNIVEVVDPTRKRPRITINDSDQTSFSLDPRSEVLYTAGTQIRLYSTSDGKRICSIPLQAEQHHPFCMEVSPDGRLLVLGDRNGNIIIKDTAIIREGRIGNRRRLSVSTGPVMDFAFPNNESDLLALSKNNFGVVKEILPIIHLINIPLTTVSRSFLGPMPDSDQICIDASGSYLATTGIRGKIWRLPTIKPDWEWTFQGKGHQVVFSPDGNVVLSSKNDRAMELVRLADDGSVTRKRIDLPVKSALLASSRNQERLVVMPSQTANRTELFSWGEDASLQKIQSIPSGGNTHQLRLSPEADRLALIGRPFTVLDLQGGKSRHVIQADEMIRPFEAVFLPGDRLAVSFIGNALRAMPGSTEHLGIWDLDTSRWTHLHTNSFSITKLDLSPDKSLLAAACSDYRLRLYDPDTLELKKSIRTHDQELLSTVWSPDGREIATSSLDLTIRFWDPTDFRLIREFAGQPRPSHHLNYSPPGDRFAAVGSAGVCRVWKLSEDHHRPSEPFSARTARE